MRKLVFTLISLACSLAFAQSVYKWVDENGVVHYSDQPHPNAEKIHVKAVQTYKPTALDTPASGAPGAAPTAAGGASYQGCAVVQPQDGQDFANVPSLNIVVQTDPVLRSGDQIFVTLDGQGLNDGKATGAQFTLSPVDRGTHTLQAQVRSADGTVMCQTPTVTFNVHQPSIANPANPVRPH
jgi:Domain of unknown function (DUF4124)